MCLQFKIRVEDYQLRRLEVYLGTILILKVDQYGDIEMLCTLGIALNNISPDWIGHVNIGHEYWANESGIEVFFYCDF